MRTKQLSDPKSVDVVTFSGAPFTSPVYGNPPHIRGMPFKVEPQNLKGHELLFFIFWVGTQLIRIQSHRRLQPI